MTTPPPLLARTPFAVFASVMGLGGLAAAWFQASVRLGAPQGIASALLGIAAVVWLGLVAVQIARLVSYPQAVRRELSDPFPVVFLATLSVGTLVLCAAALPLLGGAVAWVWWPAMVGHLAISVHVFGAWLARTDINLTTLSPAWFIPVVGTMVASFAGASIAPTGLAMALWGLGFLLWFSLQPIVLRRIFVHDEVLPARIVPTLAVLIAPAPVALIGWHALIDGPVNSGYAPVLSVMRSATPLVDATLLATGMLFLALVVLPRNRLWSSPFTLTWWATTFPVAALANASIIVFSSVAPWAAWVSLSLATVWIGYVLMRSLVSLNRDAAAFI